LVINDLIFANLPKSRRPNRSSFLKNEPPGQEVWANLLLLLLSSAAFGLLSPKTTQNPKNYPLFQKPIRCGTAPLVM
jgi:hypothetical protein